MVRVWGDGVGELLEGGAVRLHYRQRDALGFSLQVEDEASSLDEARQRGFTFSEPLTAVGQHTTIHIEGTRELPAGWEADPVFRQAVDRARARGLLEAA